MCSSHTDWSSSTNIGECLPKDHDGRAEAGSFSNEWVVHLEGGSNVADLIALRLGYINEGEVCNMYVACGLTV